MKFKRINFLVLLRLLSEEDERRENRLYVTGSLMRVSTIVCILLLARNERLVLEWNDDED